MRNRPWSGPVGSRREVLRLEWPPPSQSEITANRRQQRAEMVRQLNEGGRKLNVNIKRLHPDAVVPKYATELAAGFDLVAVEDVIIAPGETARIPLGLAFEIPPGYEMQIRPRSGITLNTNLRVGNSPGTVDADFRAEVCVIIDNVTPSTTLSAAGALLIDHSDYYGDDDYTIGTYIIRKGDRIAQGIIAPVKRVTFTEVDELGATERGSGGFGHSGVN